MISIKTVELITQAIIKSQQSVIGPLAIEQARKVSGLNVDNKGAVVLNTKDPNKLLEQLVRTYERLFGKASVEVCKEAIKESSVTIGDKDLPAILR